MTRSSAFAEHPAPSDSPGRHDRHPFHSLCSYLGSFPPRVPRRVIDSLVPSGATVLDPFCGSGTTLVEALQTGRGCIGIDKNPLAVAISRAKVQPVGFEDIDDRILGLARGFTGRVDMEGVSENLPVIFHPRTLAQLVYLREALDDDIPEDLFIKGMLLGIMHGKFRKGGDTAYLSIDMPNTFSMSPDYVRGFVKREQLRRPPLDVFAQMRERARWLFRSGGLRREGAMVLSGDATDLRAVLAKAGVPRVDGIVTSPPYLGGTRLPGSAAG